jgi:short-subunit dehydrogenase
MVQENTEQIARCRAEEGVVLLKGFWSRNTRLPSDWHKEEEMIKINVTALTYFCKLFGKDMVARKRRRILNLTSIAAFQPGPLMAVYYAIKAYVLSFSKRLRMNSRARRKVIALCTGPTVTNYFSALSMHKALVSCLFLKFIF